MMKSIDWLENRRVPFSVVAEMMAEDGGSTLEVDAPASESDIAALERVSFRFSSDYREFLKSYGSLATPTEDGIIYGASVSTYKQLLPKRVHPDTGAVMVASFDQGDTKYWMASDGSVGSDTGDLWLSFSTFLTALLLHRSSELLSKWSPVLVALPEENSGRTGPTRR